MTASIITGVLALIGTTIGSISGILTANKLTNYRIEQLEIKVDKHNKLVERMYDAETKIEVIDEKIKVANHRIDDLEGGKHEN